MAGKVSATRRVGSGRSLRTALPRPSAVARNSRSRRLQANSADCPCVSGSVVQYLVVVGLIQDSAAHFERHRRSISFLSSVTKHLQPGARQRGSPSRRRAATRVLSSCAPSRPALWLDRLVRASRIACQSPGWSPARVLRDGPSQVAPVDGNEIEEPTPLASLCLDGVFQGLELNRARPRAARDRIVGSSPLPSPPDVARSVRAVAPDDDIRRHKVARCRRRVASGMPFARA